MIVIVLPDIAAEDALLDRARRGDQRAVMEIYEGYFQPIYQFLRLRTDDAALAEDIAANVFVKLIQALRGRNAPSHSLRGWLFRVARHELARQWGRDKRYATSALEEWESNLPDDADIESQYIRRLDANRARRALRMLTPEQQEVLILRFSQALSLEETADVMGKNIGAIKSLQTRAIQTLRGVLSDPAGEEGEHGA